MTHPFDPVDLNKIRTHALSDRSSKVSASEFAGTWEKGQTFKDFIGKLPNILAVKDLKAVIQNIATAFRKNKTVALGMGAHVIKVGLNPVVIDLMERGIISAVAMNGAGIILSPEFPEIFWTIFMVPCLVGELALVLWLVIKGSKEPITNRS